MHGIVGIILDCGVNYRNCGHIIGIAGDLLESIGNEGINDGQPNIC